MLLAANEHVLPLTHAANCSINNNKFPNNGKRAVVWPLDKGEANRIVGRHFCPVSILSASSKMYGRILKNQLTPYLDKTLSLLIAAYRRSYGTQHVLIRMIEEWRIKLESSGFCYVHFYAKYAILKKFAHFKRKKLCSSKM